MMQKKMCILLVLLILGFGQIFAAPCGDVNSDGVINIVDALMIAQHYVGLNPPNFDVDAADVNADGNVNIVDALQVAQLYVGLVDKLPGCDPGPTPTRTPPSGAVTYEMQAEDQTWSDAAIDTKHAGYTGSGFVDTVNAIGTWIEWSIDVAEATDAVCDFTYACASDARSMDLSVNGVQVAFLTFPASGAWTTWVVEKAPTVSLKAGGNKIRLTSTTSGGAPNMDKMDITINSIRVTPVPPTPTPVPTATPVPTEVPPGWTPPVASGDLDLDVPVGMAVYVDDGIESTIGGNDGKVVTARTASELSSYAGSSETLYIIVEGTLSGTFSVNSNKTIIGAGSGAMIKGGLDVRSKENIIIRNLDIYGGVDSIATRGTTHVWIDHCRVGNASDGAIDITKESDYHTVSWTHFHDHDKTMLINSGTGQEADADDLNTTVHHNWYDGTKQRNPRAAYGDIHVFNTMYNNNSSYCIGLHSRCMVLSENNYFQNTKNAISQMYRDDPADINHGFAKDVGSIFDNTSGDMDNEDDLMTVNFREQYYMYDFILDPAKDVPAIVKAGAGPGSQWSTLGPLPVPGQGAIKVSTNPTLKWTKGHNTSGTVTGYAVSFGTTNPPPPATNTTGQTFSPGSLNPGTIYYWRVDQITSSGTVTGKTWVFKTQ